MNITFLIGNGFDLNLGLKTTYLDFVHDYKKLLTWDEHLREFRKNINENEKLWSNAEIALGQYTNHFEKGQAEDFAKCQSDFCEQLVNFLELQESRIDFDDTSSLILKSFEKINALINSFPTNERNSMLEIYEKRKSEEIHFNFISFNYTETLDKCIEIAKKHPQSLGKHKSGNHEKLHKIGAIVHVHGTVHDNMVFGVNDESQIAKPDIFDCEDGDLYKSLLIKQEANKTYAENTDSTTASILNNSHLIYIYGMSIGATDQLWWNRICDWLSRNQDNHLIIHNYEMPQKSVMPTVYLRATREKQREFLSFSTLSPEKKDAIKQHIHITGENIFSDINNIANDIIITNDKNVNEKTIVIDIGDAINV